MNPSSAPQSSLVPAGKNHLTSPPSQLPEILIRAGKAAVFATEEFFFGRIRNEHTRSAYLIAVRRFLAWAEARGLELRGITPKDVGQYIDGLRNESTSVSTRKQPQTPNWPERLAAAAIGMFPPALFYLIGLTTLQTVPEWMWVVSWVLTIVSIVVPVLVYVLEKQDRSGLHASVQTVITELQRLKEEYSKPPG